MSSAQGANCNTVHVVLVYTSEDDPDEPSWCLF